MPASCTRRATPPTPASPASRSPLRGAAPPGPPTSPVSAAGWSFPRWPSCRRSQGSWQIRDMPSLCFPGRPLVWPVLPLCCLEHRPPLAAATAACTSRLPAPCQSPPLTSPPLPRATDADIAQQLAPVQVQACLPPASPPPHKPPAACHACRHCAPAGAGAGAGRPLGCCAARARDARSIRGPHSRPGGRGCSMCCASPIPVLLA